ncbi:MAG TPA: PPOX class F420-dependent oxidoreductase [Trebonia sp.]|jgi:PPOX class probable F420-dependent enzyme|nr:PPOX class F420-dependent oxidoreductase [Trebonia sp.]
MTTLDEFLSQPRNVVVVGIRKDGRPQATPNWFSWDGERFYVSTTRSRAKYKIFRRDPRVELLFDDSEGFRYVGLSGTVQILEDVQAELPHFRAIREKHGRPVAPDDQLAQELIAEGRVLLAITPAGPRETWTVHGLD